METELLRYLIENWPVLAILAVVCAVSVKVTHFMTRWNDHNEQRHKDSDERHARLEESINTILKRIDTIEREILAVKVVLASKHKNVSEVFAMKKSPRRLNENGERVFSDIGGKDFLLKNKDFFFAKIDEQKPQTAFDVENAANIVCMANTNEEIFNGIKNFVYNSPTYMLKDSDGGEKPYDLSLSDICFILSIPLRDMYLAEHEEIPKD